MLKECCRKREYATCIGENDGTTKEMICLECKTTWHELVNPETGPSLLGACEAIKHAMLETQGFAPDFLTNAIDKAQKGGI